MREPHTAIRDQIETMAKEANMELHEGQQHSDPVDAEGRSYLSDLLERSTTSAPSARSC